jgi:predicted glycogen debranching enzyme
MALVDREWLVTNGIGGYASASVAGLSTRKYHGLLVAALPNPLGRTVMLHHLAESVSVAGSPAVPLTGEESGGRRSAWPFIEHLRDFRLEAGLPVWHYEIAGCVLERRVLMPHRQNTTVVLWQLLHGDAPVTLQLRPAVHFRHHEHDVSLPLQPGYRIEIGAQLHEVSCTGGPAALRLWLSPGADFSHQEQQLARLRYRVDEDRGFSAEGGLWLPGVFTLPLRRGETAALVASTEAPETMLALSPHEAIAAEHERRSRLLRMAPPQAREGVNAELVLAADQFLVTPPGRRRDAARAAAEGDEVRSVIAGYHWFTDWGRDTMISLEGLTLATGRTREAASILLTFSHYVRDGLVPNMFPDGSNEGLYHTADATLWFFHAVDRYLAATDDIVLLERLMPTLVDIAQHHLRGTRFGIGVDPADALMRQGAEGYQLTWMDAKCDGWVVTPRQGKAVEINALWHNAMCVLEACARRLGDARAADAWLDEAARMRASFNRRFWWDEGGHLLDLVDGPDGDSRECRPNQLMAISLPHPVLDPARWGSVLRVVEERLVTPMGLRTLAPGSAHYAPRYFGNLRQRDAAYHQGTVWAWLIGPWIDAWQKQHPGESTRRWLQPLLTHLDDFGIGSIAEIFDAEPPYHPRGCIAQAWSVAEVLRHVVKATA